MKHEIRLSLLMILQYHNLGGGYICSIYRPMTIYAMNCYHVIQPIREMG